MTSSAGCGVPFARAFRDVTAAPRRASRPETTGIAYSLDVRIFSTDSSGRASKAT